MKQIQLEPPLRDRQYSTGRKKRTKANDDSKVELRDFHKTKIACILGKESLVDLLPYAVKGFAEKGQALFSLKSSMKP